MENENSLFPPMQYELGWGIIAACLILLVIVFLITLLRMTRKAKPENPIAVLPKMANAEERLMLIKVKYSKNIENIRTSYRNNEISTRKAFQALSINLRNFTHEYSGSGAHAMTLTDLQQKNAPEILKEKIYHYYPLAFEEANRTGNIELAVNDALKVISLWR